MEILFDIILVTLLGSNAFISFVIYKKFIERKASQDAFHERLINEISRNSELLDYTSKKIDAMANGLDRSMSSLKELQETTKPIKPNNWDSVKEAFKGPTRIEVNERN